MGIARLAICLIVCHAILAKASAAGLTIAITVFDSVDRPVPGAQIELRSKPSEMLLSSVVTDIKGQASFRDLDERPYDISIRKEGFDVVRREIDLSLGDSAAVELTLVPTMVRR